MRCCHNRISSGSQKAAQGISIVLQQDIATSDYHPSPFFRKFKRFLVSSLRFRKGSSADTFVNAALHFDTILITTTTKLPHEKSTCTSWFHLQNVSSKHC